jgi:hypothetical protein
VFAVEAPRQEPSGAIDSAPLRLQLGAFVVTVSLATGAV